MSDDPRIEALSAKLRESLTKFVIDPTFIGGDEKARIIQRVQESLEQRFPAPDFAVNVQAGEEEGKVNVSVRYAPRPADWDNAVPHWFRELVMAGYRSEGACGRDEADAYLYASMHDNPTPLRGEGSWGEHVAALLFSKDSENLDYYTVLEMIREENEPPEDWAQVNEMIATDQAREELTYDRADEDDRG